MHKAASEKHSLKPVMSNLRYIKEYIQDANQRALGTGDKEKKTNGKETGLSSAISWCALESNYKK